ncbi:MAG: SRPBCC domain-containing protein [Methylotenera sp.]
MLRRQRFSGQAQSLAQATRAATILLELHEKDTKYTAYVQHNNVAHRIQHEKMGFEAGWGACLDQLVAILKKEVN